MEQDNLSNVYTKDIYNMYARFRGFQTPLDFSHQLWKMFLKTGDIAIDATCGNGRDTLVLAQNVLSEIEGKVYAFDIQATAIQKSQIQLKQNISQEQFARIEWVHGSHSHFPSEIEPESVAIVVYNLGYLPGSSKALITTSSTTVESLKKALELVKSGGVISITCYPGHEGGRDELEEVLKLTSALSPQEWSTTHHFWSNRNKSPQLVFLQKALK